MIGVPDPTVLIIGQRVDPHIEAVSERLASAGVGVAVLERHEPDQWFSLTFENGTTSLTVADRASALDAVRTAWWRVKPSSPAEFGVGSLAGTFASDEWREALRGIGAGSADVRWVNDVDAHVRAARKPGQLRLAAECGLRIPATTITNSPEQVLAFFDRHPRVVYKTLSSFVMPPDRIIFTTEIDRREVAESHASLRLAPGIFQEYVDKDHELRVTIIGSKVLVARIDSQAHAATRIDWRRSQGCDMYSIGEMSPAGSERLLEFHRRAGLTFAAYDLIVTPDGDEVFLECNPGGQWLWLENELGLDISGALAEILLPA